MRTKRYRVPNFSSHRLLTPHSLDPVLRAFHHANGCVQSARTKLIDSLEVNAQVVLISSIVACRNLEGLDDSETFVFVAVGEQETYK